MFNMQLRVKKVHYFCSEIMITQEILSQTQVKFQWAGKIKTWDQDICTCRMFRQKEALQRILGSTRKQRSYQKIIINWIELICDWQHEYICCHIKWKKMNTSQLENELQSKTYTCTYND